MVWSPKTPPTWQIKMPLSDQGVTYDRYTLIPRTLIFITRGESVLLLKGASDKRLWADQYNGIGGHIEPGEDILSAARRELKEETGLESNDLRLYGTVTVDTRQSPGIALYVFKGSDPGRSIRPSPEGSLRWVAFSDLEKIPLVEDLPTLLPMILQMKANEPPFHAHYWYDDRDNLQIRFGS